MVVIAAEIKFYINRPLIFSSDLLLLLYVSPGARPPKCDCTFLYICSCAESLI